MTEQSEPAEHSSSARVAGPSDEKGTGLYRHVGRQVARLQSGYLADAPWAVAALAKLRRGVGKEPGQLIELAEWTAPGLFVADQGSDEITPEEQAAHVAITLYAMHQQSRDMGMHGAGRSLGDAARELRSKLGESGEAGVLRRFNAIGTATGSAEVTRHARGLIQQLRANDIWMDYAMFAEDLRKLMNPATSSGVRNRWGRNFHRKQRSAENSDSDAAN